MVILDEVLPSGPRAMPIRIRLGEFFDAITLSFYSLWHGVAPHVIAVDLKTKILTSHLGFLNFYDSFSVLGRKKLG